MKKLSITLFAFGLVCSIYGQTTPEPVQRNLSFILGPNWDRGIKYGIYNDDILFRTGISLGLDYFQTLTPRWEAKLSAHFHHFHFVEIQYTTAFDTLAGNIIILVPDKTVYASFKQDAFGFSAGVRRWGRPKKVRWFWTGDAGGTVFVQIPKKPAMSFSLGTGWEWTPGAKNWGITAGPVVRGMFWSAPEPFANQLAFAIELGFRRINWFKPKPKS